MHLTLLKNTTLSKGKVSSFVSISRILLCIFYLRLDILKIIFIQHWYQLSAEKQNINIYLCIWKYRLHRLAVLFRWKNWLWLFLFLFKKSSCARVVSSIKMQISNATRVGIMNVRGHTGNVVIWNIFSKSWKLLNVLSRFRIDGVVKIYGFR